MTVTYRVGGLRFDGVVASLSQMMWSGADSGVFDFDLIDERASEITVWRRAEPFNDRQLFNSLSISLKTIVMHATRLPLPLVRSCRRRTVANVASIGLAVGMCRQCSAGKS